MTLATPLGSTVPSNSLEPLRGADARHRGQGFDHGANVVLVIAFAIATMVRPRELAGLMRFLPVILVLLALSAHLASRTLAGVRSVLVPFSVLVTVTWFVTTAVWSAARMWSVAEVFVVAGVAGTAVLVASFATLRQLVGGVMVGSFAVFGASVATAVLAPRYGLVSGSYQAGSLQGIMPDRNSLSFVLLLGLAATLSYDFQGPRKRICKFIIAAVMFGGVVWTSSSTCLILAVVAILLSVLLAGLRRFPSPRRGWPAAICALLVSIVVLYITSHPDELFGLVDRDSTLTGRTRIWPVVHDVISRQPWLGQGWGAVWGRVPLHDQINRSVGFAVAHSHNGYLDVQVQVGAVGLYLLLVVLSLVAFRGVVGFLKSSSSLSSWPIVLTVLLLVYNIVETSFSSPATLFLIFATLGVLSRPKEVSRAVIDRAPIHQRETCSKSLSRK